MAAVVIERLVEAWGDLSLRDPGYPRVGPLDRLAALVMDQSAERALDVAGAWIDAYSSMPGIRWSSELETGFLAALEELLTPTIYAVRDREIILRADLGAAVLVTKPLAALIVTRPDLQPIDDKLREALAELDGGKTADAVTDAGTALQTLLTHLGHTGPTLGDQVRAARKAGLFSGIDTKLGEAVENLAAWVAAVRNQMGDAQKGKVAARLGDDAPGSVSPTRKSGLVSYVNDSALRAPGDRRSVRRDGDRFDEFRLWTASTVQSTTR